jgi:hypothetical protein
MTLADIDMNRENLLSVVKLFLYNIIAAVDRCPKSAFLHPLLPLITLFYALLSLALSLSLSLI